MCPMQEELPKDSQDVWHFSRSPALEAGKARNSVSLLRWMRGLHDRSQAPDVTLCSHVTSLRQQLCKKSVDLCRRCMSDAGVNGKECHLCKCKPSASQTPSHQECGMILLRPQKFLEGSFAHCVSAYHQWLFTCWMKFPEQHSCCDQ